MIYGVIADDFTGASDIASFMVKGGFNVIQTIGIPDKNDLLLDDVDVIVVALKTRSIASKEAIKKSIAACDWLINIAHAKQIYFKYCSTFDSTPKGNIGQVSEALMDKLKTNYIIHCPALPDNGRTVVHGHLFVNGQLLNHSGMENHPINPMHSADIAELLAPQITGVIKRLELPIIEKDEITIRRVIASLKQVEKTHIICDSLTNHHLANLAKAIFDIPLIAGGSGLGESLAKLYQLSNPKALKFLLPKQQKKVVLSGSCSFMTNKQVDFYKRIAAHYELDITKCLKLEKNYIKEIVDWVVDHQNDKYAPMVYATQPVNALNKIKQRYGNKASIAIEKNFALITKLLVKKGINTFIVAGGETSGTVVSELNAKQLQVGHEIVSGVPWLKDLKTGYCLALKSGNFGQENFFKIAQGSL